MCTKRPGIGRHPIAQSAKAEENAAVKECPPERLPSGPQASKPAASTGRRFLLALSGALVAHGLLALWLWHAPRPKPPPVAQSIPVEVTFEEVAASSTPTAPSAAPSDQPAAKPAEKPTRATRAERAHAALTPPAAAQISPSAEASEIGATGPQGGMAKQDREAATLLLLAPKSKILFGISRKLRDPLASLGNNPNADRPGAGAYDNGFGHGPQGPVREPTQAEKDAAEEALVTDRVTGWITDSQAIARADPTRDRDGYWQDVQDALSKGFDPGWEIRDERGGAGTSSVPNAMQLIAQQYAKSAENYGKTGSPTAAQPKPQGYSMNQDFTSTLAADRGLSGTALDNPLARIQQAGAGLGATAGAGNSPWLQRLVVHILLTQRNDGSLDVVSIAGSSGNPVYDQLVLGQARKLSQHGLLGAPPKDHRRTIWAFETDFEQAPPMPVAGCKISGSMLPTDCFYPFKRSVSSRVRLEAVY
jgi:outer membrane biosynthesis protein TonB